MAYFAIDDGIMPQDLNATSTTALNPLGSRTYGRDVATATAYGDAHFIYLLGCASTVVGSLVVFDGASSGKPTFQTVLAPSTANLGQPLAVSMSANVAGQYGWYMLAGVGVLATNGTLVAGPGPLYIVGPGQVTSTATAGKQVVNARNLTATGTPAANQAVCQINYPFAQGAIT